MNTWIGDGRLTREPDMRTTQSGKSVCLFRIAIDDHWGNDDKKQPTFLSIVAWGKTAENCGRYLEKGQMVIIRGRINNRAYTDKSGNEKQVTEIVADTVEFGPKAKNSGGHNSASSATYGADQGEDIPF